MSFIVWDTWETLYRGLAAVNQGCSQNRPTLPGKSRAELWLVVLRDNLFLLVHNYKPRVRESLA